MNKPLTKAELKALDFGHGWLENWSVLEADDGSEQDYIHVQRVGWADGMFAMSDSYATLENILKNYNRRGGVRVWLGGIPPTEEQRKAATWDA